MSERPDNLHRSIEAAKALRLHLTALVRFEDVELTADDLQAIQDTFEGETTLDAEIRNAVLAMDEDEIMVVGLRAHVDEMTTRRRRFEKRIEARRGLIEQAMTVAGLPKLEMDIGTLSCRAAKPGVEVDDESLIPSQFFTRPDPAISKAGLTKTMLERHKALQAADQIRDETARTLERTRIDREMPAIPGCHVEEGGVTLFIRRK